MKRHLKKRRKKRGKTMILLTWFALKRAKCKVIPQSEVFAAFYMSTV